MKTKKPIIHRGNIFIIWLIIVTSLLLLGISGFYNDGYKDGYAKGRDNANIIWQEKYDDLNFYHSIEPIGDNEGLYEYLTIENTTMSAYSIPFKYYSIEYGNYNGGYQFEIDFNLKNNASSISIMDRDCVNKVAELFPEDSEEKFEHIDSCYTKRVITGELR